MSVIIKNNQLTVEIAEKGAELLSVKGSSGKEYIWQGDPKYWENHAPILFPIVSRLKNEEYIYQGKKYSMGIHGFARFFDFAVEKQSETSVTMLLASNEETLKQYPFEFEFRVVYTLIENKLSVDFITTNKTKGNMYYSVGSHEGYAINGDISNYSLVLDEAETLAQHKFVDGYGIVEEKTPCFENTNELKLNDDYFATDAIIFLDMKSRGMALRDDRTGEKIHVSFPDADTVLAWKVPKAEYICLEPWCGVADLEWKPFNDFSEKFRNRKLSKGESETINHTITF